MTFQKVLDKYRKISFSERDKGDRFERLMQRIYSQILSTHQNLRRYVFGMSFTEKVI